MCWDPDGNSSLRDMWFADRVRSWEKPSAPRSSIAQKSWIYPQHKRGPHWWCSNSEISGCLWTSWHRFAWCQLSDETPRMWLTYVASSQIWFGNLQWKLKPSARHNDPEKEKHVYMHIFDPREVNVVRHLISVFFLYILGISWDHLFKLQQRPGPLLDSGAMCASMELSQSWFASFAQQWCHAAGPY